MSGEIIEFPGAARRPARKASHKPAATEVTAIGERILTPRQLRREGRPELPPPATETARNSRLMSARRDAWWLADRASDYWRARIDWNHALGTAQHWGIADSASLPPATNENLHGLVDTWRAAVAKQLITPAPTVAVIAWKRARIKSRDFERLPITLERAERAIADDVAFLAAHPTRRSTAKEWRDGASSMRRCASVSGTSPQRAVFPTKRLSRL
jgi:hypothetical protein